MGNSYCCQDYYLSLPCAQQNKRGSLLSSLSKTLTNSEFKDVCLNTIERYYDDALQLEKQQVLRHSIASFSHYETNNLNHSLINDEDSQESMYQNASPIDSMPPENKQRYLLKLIRESYLFLDFSDCIDNRKSYDRFMRHQLIKGDPSFQDSFLIENKSIIAHLESQLKSFNEEMICKLQNYVRFCRKVKHDFTPDRQRFLSKLNLNLQSQIVQKYLNRQFRKNPNTLSEMMGSIQEVVRILIVTVQMMYDFQMKGETLRVEDQLFNSLNIYTMITSIVFQSEDFAQFIINKVKECFRHRFNIYRNEGQYTTAEFINDFIALNSKEGRRENRTATSHLFSTTTYSNILIFPRSSKLLERIFGKSVPLFKLKIIYELNQELTKELQQLKHALSDRYGVELNSVFTRETELMVIKWLLKANGQAIDDLASHLLYTYYFVHRMHLMDKKGSCLVTFMQEIQRILQFTPQK